MRSCPTRHIALQFGNVRHFHDGLGEFARQLAQHIALQAAELRADRNWYFHYYLPEQWHGMFGDGVSYHALSPRHRFEHSVAVDFDVWHGLHQHLRFRPPVNSRCKIITVHDLNYVYRKTGLSLWRNGIRMRRRLCRAHQLVAVSQYARDDLLRYLPATPPTEVIHNGVADLSQALVTNVPQLEGLPFFLHISRMSSNKNVESLLELAASWPEQLFVMAGPLSEEVRKHQAYCHQQELRNVLFLTDVSESVKAWLYAHCQVFLFPSLVEGFGLPPIEALYFGKPVVVARRTSLPEICGDAVQYWDDFEPAAMRAAISELLQRIQAGRWSAANARAQAKRYQWSEVTAQYLDLYARGIGRCP